MSDKKIPNTPSNWKIFAEKNDPPIRTIHDFGALKSGSKIEQPQFLALRVIWKSSRAGEFKPENYGLDPDSLDEHHKLLNGIRGWKEYCKSIATGSEEHPDFGRFDLVWDFQKQVEALFPAKSSSAKLIGPVGGMGNRSKPPPQMKTPSRPSRSVKSNKRPRYNFDDEPDLDEDVGDQETEEKLTPLKDLILSDASPASTKDGQQFPPADDEQTVNTALILLLKAVCLTSEGLRSAPWALERKAFVLGKPKLYEARTDGHLRYKASDSKVRSLAILEVKSGLREELEPRMQESAQMAAWIYAEPDTPTSDGTYRYVNLP